MLSEKEYNELYDKICKVVEGKDVCGFAKNGGVCNREKGKGSNASAYCCCGNPVCKYWIEGKGCGTKAIACKLWYCGHAELTAEMEEKLSLLYNEANRKRFYFFRGNFQDAERLYK